MVAGIDKKCVLIRLHAQSQSSSLRYIPSHQQALDVDSLSKYGKVYSHHHPYHHHHHHHHQDALWMWNGIKLHIIVSYMGTELSVRVLLFVIQSQMV